MPRTHLELLARAAQLLARLAAAAHQRLDRAARQLTGAPDSVDQHWAEMIAATGQHPDTWQPSSPAEREYVDALHRLVGLPHPDAIPDSWRQSDDPGKRLTLTDVVDVLMQHLPGNSVGAPERALAFEHRPHGDLIVPTLTNVEVVDQAGTARALGDMTREYYGNGPIFVAPSDGDDLAALLSARGLLVARRLG